MADKLIHLPSRVHTDDINVAWPDGADTGYNKGPCDWRASDSVIRVKRIDYAADGSATVTHLRMSAAEWARNYPNAHGEFAAHGRIGSAAILRDKAVR